MSMIETDVLVIGSGAGAAGLVPELVKKNKTVTVVEQAVKNPDLGKGLDDRGKRIFKPDGFFPKSREGLIFYHHHGLGGTLEISCANAVAPTELDLSVLGIPICDEVDGIMLDMGVTPFPETHLGKNASMMMDSARKNGYPMQPMPKFIDFDQCTACAMCELICPNRAKWSSRRMLESLSSQNMDGLMVKIKDEPGGRVNPDGSVSKIDTSVDRATIQRGVDIAEKILMGCGAKNSSITVTSPRGAHPGGTAAIGTVVDKDLKVMKTNNVYVADASVLPQSPGKPPIITIMALAKRLGKAL